MESMKLDLDFGQLIANFISVIWNILTYFGFMMSL